MDRILRLTGAARYDPAADLWLDTRVPALGAIAKLWFAQMRGCGNDVRELLHDGCPVACVEDAPFAYVNVFKTHVNVGFFQGAALDDPAGLLEGTGKHMRHANLKPESVPEAPALRALVAASYADIKTRLELERAIGADRPR